MRRRVLYVTLVLLAAAAAAPRASAGQESRVEAPITGAAGEQPLTREERIARATNVRAALIVVDDELRHGLISAEQAARARAFYLEAARASLGGGAAPASVRDLDAYIASQRGVVRRVAGLASFTSLVLTLAAIITVVALGWLFRAYFKRLPLWGYELLGHGAAAALIAGGHAIGRALGIDGGYVALMGCLIFLAAIALTYATRVFPRIARGGKADLERIVLAQTPRGLLLTPVNFISACGTVVWGATALWYQSTPVAVGATLAVVSFVGFTIFVTPVCYYFGYTDEEKIPMTMLVALAMIGAYLAVQGGLLAPGPAGIFTRPFAWVGTLVYFISLLIIASRTYAQYGRKRGKALANPWRHFWTWQAIAVLSFFAGLYVGPALGAAVLSGVSGTLFACYLMEKYLEIPWRGRGWAWGALGAGALLYAIGRAATTWPQYFLW